MSNWRDRTERDAMVRGKAYQKPTKIPTSSRDEKLTVLQLIASITALVMSIISASFGLYTYIYNSGGGSGGDSAGPVNHKITMAVPVVAATCEKDAHGNFTTRISSQKVKQSVALWNSETRCTRVATMLNEQFALDQLHESVVSATITNKIVRIRFLEKTSEIPLSNVQVAVFINNSLKEETFARSDSSGYIEFTAPLKSNEFRIVMMKEGFVTREEIIDLTSDSKRIKTYYLNPTS
jgi:hypothetical protein